MSSLIADLKNEKQIFLNYLRSKFPIFHNSNFFYRDFQYGLKSFLEKKGTTLTYNNLTNLTKQLSEFYESEGIFVRTSSQGWKVNYPDFITVKPGDPFSYA